MVRKRRTPCGYQRNRYQSIDKPYRYSRHNPFAPSDSKWYNPTIRERLQTDHTKGVQWK